MSGLAGRKALVKVAGAPVAFANEATTDAGDHQTYQITDATKRIWDRATTPVVKVGGAVAAEAYTFNRLTGKVTFAVVNAGRAAVTVSGNYVPTSVAIGAKMYSYALAATAQDDTDFDGANSAGGFTSVQPGMKTLTGSIGRKLSIDTYMRDALIAGDPVLIEIYADRTATPDLLCWALLTKDAISSALDAIQEGSVDFTGAPDDQGIVVATA